MSEIVDTGFDAVIAGDVYKHPEPDPQPVTAPETVLDSASPPEPAPQEITATVNPGLTPEGVQAAKSLVALPALDWPTLSKLAREIAMDIKERHVILKDFNLNGAQYEYLETYNEFYQQALAAACKDWHAPLTTPERLKIEAAAILEDGMAGLGARMQSKSEGLPGVIEAAKLFAKIAGVGEREAGPGNPGERFTINIDLGGDQRITVQSAPPAQSIAQPDSHLSLPSNPQGEG